MKPNHILTAVLLLTLSACAGPAPEPTPPSGRTIEPTRWVSFLNSRGDTLSTLHVAMAVTPNDITTGLMDVRSMGADHGMLFVFESDEPRSFWMANTPLSLDMFFIDKDFRIRRIHSNTTPLSHQSYTSDAPVRYVIETNAGYSLTHDITEGHTIRLHD